MLTHLPREWVYNEHHLCFINTVTDSNTIMMAQVEALILHLYIPKCSVTFTSYRLANGICLQFVLGPCRESNH